MLDLRVEKERSEATLTLSNGASVRGSLFVSAGGPGHRQRERIKDVLNAEPGFFPFEVQDNGSRGVALYHRDHVVFVTLPSLDEPQQDPGYDIAVARDVSLLLADGTRLAGRIRIYTPPGHDRLSDYARGTESFLYLEAPDCTYVINARQIVELREISPL
jgi:hypothetical protein